MIECRKYCVRKRGIWPPPENNCSIRCTTVSCVVVLMGLAVVIVWLLSSFTQAAQKKDAEQRAKLIVRISLRFWRARKHVRSHALWQAEQEEQKAEQEVNFVQQFICVIAHVYPFHLFFITSNLSPHLTSPPHAHRLRKRRPPQLELRETLSPPCPCTCST